MAAQRRAAAALPLSPSTACCALSWRRDSEHGDVARETLRVFSVKRWQQLMPRAHCCAQERAVGRARHDWTAPTEPCDGPVAVAVTRIRVWILVDTEYSLVAGLSDSHAHARGIRDALTATPLTLAAGV